MGISKTSVGKGDSGAHPGYFNFVQYNEEHDIALVIITPFIDYNGGNMDNIIALSQCMGSIMESALTIYDEY